MRLPRREASPDFLPPVGGKDPGGQGYVHHIALVPIGTPPLLLRGVIILNPDTVVIILAGSHCSYPCPAVIVLPPTAVLTIVRVVIILNPNR